ncbi:MAG: hypothetical protein DRI73_01435, partial [Bacteroidetes bacterium]
MDTRSVLSKSLFTGGSILENREKKFGWFLILPSIIIIVSLVLYPIVYNIFLSFFEVKVTGSNEFTGIQNHFDIVTDPAFWQSVTTSIVYVLFTTLGTTLVGLCVALLMNREFPLRGLVRSLILLPYVAPVIAVVYSWQF